MDAKTYHRNQLVVDTDGGGRYRLLSFDLDTDIAWLISLRDEDLWPLPFDFPFSTLSARFEPEPPRVEPRPPAVVANTGVLVRALARSATPTEVSQSALAWERIEPLVDHPAIFDPSARNRLLIARSNELKALDAQKRKDWTSGEPFPRSVTGTPKTLLKDLRAYWQGGQTQDALRGNYRNSGRPSVDGTGNRGSDRPDGSRPYQSGADDIKWMREAIETFYFAKGEIRTLTATLQELHETHYTYEDGNGTKFLKPTNEAPSYRQLRSFLSKHYPLEQQLRRRKGDKEFERNHRAKLGSVQRDCRGVGDIYEFDATIFDLQLVSTKDRAAIVGKPTVYLIIDRASRMIVGYYAGFENASYTAAMLAILSIGEPKEELCARLGLPYDPDDWYAHGILPSSFLADQGTDTTGKNARRSIARSLRTTLSNVPGLRPDWKPLVECGFKMLPAIIAPHAPGYSPDSDNRKRRAPKHDKDACLNILEFEALLVAAIISHNKSMQADYPISFHQLKEQVRPIPRELFRHGIQKEMGQLDIMDFERVRAELMPRGTGTISEDGLKFEQLFYSCPEAIARGWFVEGRRHRKPVEVAFDYRLCDHVIVYAPDGSGESFVAELTGDSKMFHGMAFADVERHFWDVKELTAAGPDVNRTARYEFNQFIKPLGKKAHTEMKVASQGVSRSSRKKDTAGERAAALNRERAASAGAVSPSQRVLHSTGRKHGHVSEAGAEKLSAALPQATAAVIPFARPLAVADASPQAVSNSSRHESDISGVTAQKAVAAPEASPAVPVANRPMTLKERMAAERKRMLG